MPELPEVEGFRSVAQPCIGRTIRRVEVEDPYLLKGLSPATLARRLEGRRVSAVERYGKHLFLEIPGAGVLEMHFGMNGFLALVPRGEQEPSHVRLSLGFAGGETLAYVNPRRFGHLRLAKDRDASVAEQGLGPDALDPSFDLAALSALAARKRDIKSVLMDQSLVAGIGNIWSDEILFQARIDPRTSAAALDKAALARLFRALKEALQTAVDRHAGSEAGAELLPKRFLMRERHAGGHCPRCGAALATLRQRGRTTYYCAHCQTRP